DTLALDDLRTGGDGILNDLVLVECDSALCAEGIETHAGDMDGTPDGKLTFAVFARREPVNITDVCIQTRRKEITETCAVEHSTRTEHFACRKSALLLNKVCDDVHRIGNDHHGAAIVVL